MAIANEESIQGAAAQLILAQGPEQIGAAVAALIIANNPQYAAVSGLLALAINAILLGRPVSVPPAGAAPAAPAAPVAVGGLLGWLRRLLGA